VAFQFLQGHRGQQTANEIVRRAVIAARSPTALIGSDDFDNTSAIDDACRQMELDISGWVLNPGTENLGRLASKYPHRFGKCILTTNFDPLIEVAIQRAGGHHFITRLYVDGNIDQTEGSGCHVIHLHGYWRGSDTLHTMQQLGQLRPRLRASLSSLLRNKLVVVCAYSGWDDIFTSALMDVVRDDTVFPEILWTYYSTQPNVEQIWPERLRPGIDRGRVTLYAGIDCNQLFPKLYDLWVSLEIESPLPTITQSNPVQISNEFREKLKYQTSAHTVIEGDDEDRPPFVEICVGRDNELQKLSSSSAKIVFLTGIGGQGKSTLAAHYFGTCQSNHSFKVYVWRDCKEESELFENQLTSVIERLSGGYISRGSLTKQGVRSVVEILAKLIRDVDVLFVFDNADHYVNLEVGQLVGGPQIFMDALLRSESNSRAIFTCRPSVIYDDTRTLSCHLQGLTLDVTVRLFAQRGAPSERAEIESAHALTEGHAFWLDLLAIQVARRASSIDLTVLVDEIRSGRGLLPENTLKSIWVTLKDREQIVLRAMAETVTPSTEVEISEYLRRQMNYSKVMKALSMLRMLNLVVVKQRPNVSDVLELHPLVRQFILHNFTTRERFSFIKAIIKVYKRFMGSYESQLDERPSLSTLQYWTQNAELEINAHNFNDAFLTLEKVASAFVNSAYPREFSRAARVLLSSVDWVADHQKFRGFETVFKTHKESLSYLGEYSEVENLLDMYERTVLEKDSRYINYCEMRCHSKWVRGQFSAAVEWGKRGQGLKNISGVDTEYDVDFTLALAERDAGQPEAALPVFLKSRSLPEVADPHELDEAAGGAYYGNIGRCLHFMGQIDEALICYQKSALLIEKDPGTEHVLNQGYIRTWIGELLVGREQLRLAEFFFRAAHLKWQQVAPPKASKLMLIAKQLKSRVPESSDMSDREIEQICLDWIMGRNLDTQYR
jgi:tetratricopeptide (TPR) repeat protein